MMDERIKQLAEQCTRHRSHWMTIDDKPVQLTEHVEVFDKEKFAELIVRECAAMTRNLSPHGELAERAVKEHFGVEE